MTKLAVIDYGLGNIKSICNALERTSASVIYTRDLSQLMDSNGVILPGVGAFPHAIKKLREYGLDAFLHEYAALDRPILGICLGMQLLFDYSEEFSGAEGLGLIPGKVLKLPLNSPIDEKLPHVSWNEIYHARLSWGQTILSGISNKEDMYFVHSYYVTPDDPNHVLSNTTYSNFEYCSSVKHGKIYGCQFHPEKSANNGLTIIKNFVDLCGRKNV